MSALGPRVLIRDWLARARALGVARLDAQLLLAYVLDRPRAWLLAHDDEALRPAVHDVLDALLHRRAQGTPLAYLTGQREFRGLTLEVNAAVLVPRPETEGLVDWALELAFDSVVDLGTGSGAIALALKQARPGAAVCASDASAPALEVARRNAARHGLAIEFVAGDWWAPLAGRRFALAVSNPPYIAGGDPHLSALAHEPRSALTPDGDGPGDGLAALRRIVAGAPARLRPGSWLLLEHGHDQGDAVRSLLLEAGFEPAQTRTDLAGLPRCSGARWPG